MTERPDHVFIGPHRFEIRWSQAEMVRTARNTGQDRFGQTELGSFIITADDSRPLTGMQETLLHEVLHALIWEAGITVPEDKEASEYDREEKLVGQMSGVLLDCLKRNPHVVAWLTS